MFTVYILKEKSENVFENFVPSKLQYVLTTVLTSVYIAVSEPGSEGSSIPLLQGEEEGVGHLLQEPELLHRDERDEQREKSDPVDDST